jgi:hypothetical protein
MGKIKLEDILIITEEFLGGIDELVYNPITNNPADEFDKGSDGGVVKDKIRWDNHDDHLHIGTTNRDVMMQLIDKAQGMGLSSTENPYAKNDPNSKVDKVHATGSFHYKEFEGQPTVGAGVDFSGTKATLREFIRWINANYKGKQSPTNATVEAPEAPKGTTKTPDDKTTIDTATSSSTPASTTTDYGDLSYLDPLIDKLPLKALAKSFVNTGVAAESTESKKINEQINRIKSIMNL